MKKQLVLAVAVLLLAALSWIALGMTTGNWSGVDESVVERTAEEAGRPARDPYINTDQGDLLLFVFLLAGACGGFVAGYFYRALFPSKGGASES
ncbi:MAG: cobalt transporter [Syntrophaceae bacterium]